MCFRPGMAYACVFHFGNWCLRTKKRPALQFAIHYCKPINVRHLSLAVLHKQQSLPRSLQVELKGLDIGLVPAIPVGPNAHSYLVQWNIECSLIYIKERKPYSQGEFIFQWPRVARRRFYMSLAIRLSGALPSFIAPQYPWHGLDYASQGLHHLNMHVFSSCRTPRKCKNTDGLLD